MLIENKKAGFDYIFLEKEVAGMMLTGQQAKQIQNNQFSLVGTYVSFVSGNAVLIGDTFSVPLLLTKKQNEHFSGSVRGTGLTVVPVGIDRVNGKFKVTIALAKGKKKYDKRAAAKEKDAKREVARMVVNLG